MIARLLVALALIAAAVIPASSSAQTAGNTVALTERAVRRDIPLTNTIRRAFAAGTRDSTGRPGPNYWQLRVDYTIHASLDPATSIVTGRETVVIHNTSDVSLSSLQLRLDQNIFAANVPRLEAAPAVTAGMPIMRMALDGKPVDLNPPPRRFRRGGPPPEV
ncbi:MAG: M1 family peptidase, partial [Gemmatimonadales bacterium]|nr:M1 family peptidase [Gemmatimonadales bacterium]